MSDCNNSGGGFVKQFAGACGSAGGVLAQQSLYLVATPWT